MKNDKIKEILEKHKENYMGGFKAIPIENFESLTKDLKQHLSESKEEKQEVENKKFNNILEDIAFKEGCDSWEIFFDCYKTSDAGLRVIQNAINEALQEYTSTKQSEEKPTEKSVEGIKTKDEILLNMTEEMPWSLPINTIPYILEAMDIYAKQHKESEANELLHNSNIEKLRATKSNGEWRRLLAKILEPKQK